MPPRFQTMSIMAQFAMLFPGQGAQSRGMLQELAETDPAVSETWAEAGEVLDYDMASLVAQDPDGCLDQTEFTQPALVAAGVAVWRAWQVRGGAEPAMLAGHSLGEYTALVAAGALDFADALRLTRLRGRAMQDAVKADDGAMAAVIGLDDDKVRALCTSVTTGEDHLVAPANFNAPGQVVMAGHAGAVAEAGERAREQGARMVKPLAVSVPSHCGLMQPAADQLAAHLQDIELRQPEIPVLHNVDARTRDSVEGIREALVAQLARSVLWSDTIRAMSEAGCDVLLECGPGNVLTGLNRRIDRKIKGIALKDADGMRDGLAAA